MLGFMFKQKEWIQTVQILTRSFFVPMWLQTRFQYRPTALPQSLGIEDGFRGIPPSRRFWWYKPLRSCWQPTERRRASCSIYWQRRHADCSSFGCLTEKCFFAAKQFKMALSAQILCPPVEKPFKAPRSLIPLFSVPPMHLECRACPAWFVPTGYDRSCDLFLTEEFRRVSHCEAAATINPEKTHQKSSHYKAASRLKARSPECCNVLTPFER